MLTDGLTDLQFYSLMISILALGFAGLLTVIVWPIADMPVDRGGFQ